uniref:Uncharacterized protein n=1 Tax=Setaria italica TaxID=4555 RepID=K4AH57_SETIT
MMARRKAGRRARRMIQPNHQQQPGIAMSHARSKATGPNQKRAQRSPAPGGADGSPAYASSSGDSAAAIMIGNSDQGWPGNQRDVIMGDDERSLFD